MPRLTCITTTYNEGAALLTSVQSVLTQSFTDFQYVIVDDGSLPETIAILDGLRDPRVLLIRQANEGLSSARNRALEHASGDYICFLDADDIRPNWSFDAIVNAIDATSPDLLLCPGILQNLRGEISGFYDTAIFDQLHEHLPLGLMSSSSPDLSIIRTLAQQIEPQSANKVVRRKFLENFGIRFPDTQFFEDIFFHTHVIASANSIATLDCPAFTYFRRYQRPQITTTAGDLRFDIIAVTKLTLEMFARQPAFFEPGHRVAVFASCLKIMEWCGDSIALHHRADYHQCAKAMIRLIDPLYTHLPYNLPLATGNLDQTRRYLETLTGAI